MPRRLGGRDLLHRGSFDARLGSHHGCRLALDVLGRGAALLLLGLRLLLRRRRRGWRRRRLLADIDYAQDGLRLGEIDLSRDLQESQQYRRIHRGGRDDRAASVLCVEVGPVHASGQRDSRAGVAVTEHARAPGATSTPGAHPWDETGLFSGWSCFSARRRGWPCRPCSRSRAASPDPSPQIRASTRHFSYSACSISLQSGSPATPF